MTICDMVMNNSVDISFYYCEKGKMFIERDIRYSV